MSSRANALPPRTRGGDQKFIGKYEVRTPVGCQPGLRPTPKGDRSGRVGGRHRSTEAHTARKGASGRILAALPALHAATYPRPKGARTGHAKNPAILSARAGAALRMGARGRK